MSEHPNAALMRRGFAAFNSGDIDVLREMMAEDCVQHIPGHHRLAGSHRGRDNILAVYARMGELTQGTFRADLEELYAGDDEVVAIYQARGDRDGKHLDTRHAVVFTIRDGRIVEAKEIALDVDLEDQFWAEAHADA